MFILLLFDRRLGSQHAGSQHRLLCRVKCDVAIFLVAFHVRPLITRKEGDESAHLPIIYSRFLRHEFVDAESALFK